MDSGTVGLVTAGVGATGALVGTWFTQWRADVRERERVAAEERRERSRANDEADRARESRLFEHRRTIYAEVVRLYHFWIEASGEIELGLLPEPEEDAWRPLMLSVSEVDLYGSQEAGQAARRLVAALRALVDGLNGTYREAHNACSDFIDAARVDLGAPLRIFPGGTRELTREPTAAPSGTDQTRSEGSD